MKKAELLLPAGNIETFYAALDGGADAIYLGLKQFNAREKADNFKNRQIPVLIDLAHQNECKVYITLNTVIKNNELTELLDVLAFLESVKPDAVIIQDWGVYYLIRNFFPGLTIHASTQMANHNSSGAAYSYKKGFERVILARELTLNEIKEISFLTEIETEVFVHGALCYSFSGMCSFSSYLGGHGANRGLCSQVCRRHFNSGDQNKYYFSLKDNQQIENIQEIIKAGVASLKIEGRLKSADYVYKVSQAYRSVIDNNYLSNAREHLKTETGRKKTAYFLGNDLSDSITYESPNTGLYLGKIKNVSRSGFEIETDVKLEHNFRIRIKHPKTEEQFNLKVKEFEQSDKSIKIKTDKTFEYGSKVYLSGITEKKFSSKLPDTETDATSNNQHRLGQKKKELILKSLIFDHKKKAFSLFVKIDSLRWMRKVRFDKVDNIILSFPKKDFEQLDLSSGFLQKFKYKIWIELPYFISEKEINYYKEFANRLVKMGFDKFFLSHVSQKLFLPKNAKFAGNENVYAYNDASVAFLTSEGFKLFTYPFENDENNIEKYQNTNGIMPIYFYPRLFTSRMPVKIDENKLFKDDMNNSYYKVVKDGITYTFPDIPVSFLQYVHTFKKQGFKNFLIDLSFESPSSNRFETILKRFQNSSQIQPSVNFNYKRELK